MLKIYAAIMAAAGTVWLYIMLTSTDVIQNLPLFVVVVGIAAFCFGCAAAAMMVSINQRQQKLLEIDKQLL